MTAEEISDAIALAHQILRDREALYERVAYAMDQHEVEVGITESAEAKFLKKHLSDDDWTEILDAAAARIQQLTDNPD
jgi:hypothetical protein